MSIRLSGLTFPLVFSALVLSGCASNSPQEPVPVEFSGPTLAAKLASSAVVTDPGQLFAELVGSFDDVDEVDEYDESLNDAMASLGALRSVDLPDEVRTLAMLVQRYRDAVAALNQSHTADPQIVAEAVRRLADLESQWAESLLVADLGPGTLPESGSRSDALASASQELAGVALQRYEALLQASPDPQLQYQIARLHSLHGQNIDKAISGVSAEHAALRDLVSDSPDSVYASEAHFRLAEDLFVRERYDEAAKHYLLANESALKAVSEGGQSNHAVIDPIVNQSGYMLAWSLFRSGDASAASAAYLRTLQQICNGNLDCAERDRWTGSEREFVDDLLRGLVLAVEEQGGYRELATLLAVPETQGLASPSWQSLLFKHFAGFYLDQERYLDASGALALFVSLYPVHIDAPALASQRISVLQDAGLPEDVLRAEESFIAAFDVHSAYVKARGRSALDGYRKPLKNYLDRWARRTHVAAQASDSPDVTDKSKTIALYADAADAYRIWLDNFAQDSDAPQVAHMRAELLEAALQPEQAMAGYRQALALQDGRVDGDRVDKEPGVSATGETLYATFRPAESRYALVRLSRLAWDDNSLHNELPVVAVELSAAGNDPLTTEQSRLLTQLMSDEEAFFTHHSDDPRAKPVALHFMHLLYDTDQTVAALAWIEQLGNAWAFSPAEQFRLNQMVAEGSFALQRYAVAARAFLELSETPVAVLAEVDAQAESEISEPASTRLAAWHHNHLVSLMRDAQQFAQSMATAGSPDAADEVTTPAETAAVLERFDAVWAAAPDSELGREALLSRIDWQERNGDMRGALRTMDRLARETADGRLRLTLVQRIANEHETLWQQQYAGKGIEREIDVADIEEVVASRLRVAEVASSSREQQGLVMASHFHAAQWAHQLLTVQSKRSSDTSPGRVHAMTAYVTDLYEQFLAVMPLSADDFRAVQIEAYHSLLDLCAEPACRQTLAQRVDDVIPELLSAELIGDRERYLLAQTRLILAREPVLRHQQFALTNPLAESLQKKQQLLARAEQALTAAAEPGVASVVTQTMHENGLLYVAFAEALHRSERPPGLSAAQEQAYASLLAEQATPFIDRAVALLDRNVSHAAGGIYDQWVEASLQELATLDPVRYARESMSVDEARQGLRWNPLSSLDGRKSMVDTQAVKAGAH